MKIWESTAHNVVKFITQWPQITIIIVTAITLSMLLPALKLTVDASPDSLLLENDPDLQFYRSIHDQYGTDEYIIVAIKLRLSALSTESIEIIEKLRNKFSSINFVSNVTTITTVPLVFQRLKSNKNDSLTFPTLLSKNVDLNLVKTEFTQNPLYESNLIDNSLSIVAFKIDFVSSPEFKPLYDKRYLLVDKKRSGNLTKQENLLLQHIDQSLDLLKKQSNHNYKESISNIRKVLDELPSKFESYISGAPLIANDMKYYVFQDIKIFGITVLIAMMIILFIIFHKIKWVLITLACAFINVVIVSGIIKLLDFNLTVVSSNYVAILLIFSLAIGIHVVIRYQEESSYVAKSFDKQLYTAIEHISTPCLYMVLTSTVAFLSLIISDVKPVIVFGYIMVIGLCVAYIISFTILPLFIKLLHPTSRPPHKHYSHNILEGLLALVLTYKKTVIIFLFLSLVFSLFGVTKLTVENRFIDYFKTSTDIHRGLLIIDQKLGGTVPIEIILDAPISNIEIEEGPSEFDDYLASLDENEGGYTAQSYWYNKRGLDKIRSLHTFLESYPQIGKVLSLSTTEDIFKRIVDESELDDFQLSAIYSKVPKDVKDILIHPYLSDDGNQTRLVARLKDSDHTLLRNELLQDINKHLIEMFSATNLNNMRLNGIGVLYNNVLQSLYRSQILTLSVVFISIFLILSLLFKSTKFALIATVPNIFTAIFILGFMGIVSIPLNIMTITIAAITIGIGVDDAIHYIHRYKKEFAIRLNSQESIRTSQVTVGKALWFTSFTIASGFILLTLSNFTPTIYFGLFTCMAMLTSIFSTFTFVPLSLSIFPDRSQS